MKIRSGFQNNSNFVFANPAIIVEYTNLVGFPLKIRCFFFVVSGYFHTDLSLR